MASAIGIQCIASPYTVYSFILESWLDLDAFVEMRWIVSEAPVISARLTFRIDFDEKTMGK